MMEKDNRKKVMKKIDGKWKELQDKGEVPKTGEQRKLLSYRKNRNGERDRSSLRNAVKKRRLGRVTILGQRRPKWKTTPRTPNLYQASTLSPRIKHSGAHTKSKRRFARCESLERATQYFQEEMHAQMAKLRDTVRETEREGVNSGGSPEKHPHPSGIGKFLP